ncbi:MAG: hypothetical protein JWM98_15 [Thermoleophilia bacterium]|nr:hypothetical protein [Thermoleophilia bacterium]
MRLAGASPGPAPAEPVVLAEFNYVIRGPHAVPRMGHIEAQAWPTAAVTLAGGASFDDAVRAAQAIAARPTEDGIHHVPVNQAQGVLQAADGALSIVALGGQHRGQAGPLFIDGRFFEAAALSLQVARRSTELVAVVGATRVLDLRRTGAAFVQSGNANPPQG